MTAAGPATVFSVLALALLVTGAAGARPSYARLVLAGLLLAYTTFIYYSNAIMGLPAVLYLDLVYSRARRLHTALAALIPFGVAGISALIPLWVSFGLQ